MKFNTFTTYLLTDLILLVRKEDADKVISSLKKNKAKVFVRDIILNKSNIKKLSKYIYHALKNDRLMKGTTSTSPEEFKLELLHNSENQDDVWQFIQKKQKAKSSSHVAKYTLNNNNSI